MKRTFLLLSGLVSLCAAQAQVKEGTIVYEQKTNMHRLITDEQMRAMMPQFRTARFSLLFSDSVSLYKAIPEDEAPDPFAGSGSRTTFRFGAAGGDLYKNFAQSRSVQATELGGKNFLITDSIRQQPWKLGTETKQILGYTCHRATRKVPQPQRIMRQVSTNSSGAATNDTTSKTAPGKEMEVVAWYADDLISPVGPDSYGLLPGVILEVDIDNGATVYNAVEIKKTVDAKELKEPKKGKVVTRQEYSKMMMDMMGNPGPGGMLRIGGGA